MQLIMRIQSLIYRVQYLLLLFLVAKDKEDLLHKESWKVNIVSLPNNLGFLDLVYLGYNRDP